MKICFHKVAIVFLAVFLAGTTFGRNVILFIGDGMGFQQVAAARYYNGAPLAFEGLPYNAECRTYSANSSVTDSAAAGTALATATKVNNGVISMAYPGDGSELQTLLEYNKDRGQSVGLVTTTYLTHATPASFGAHETSRNNVDEIADDYLTQTLPHVMFGGGGNGLSVGESVTAGYAVATTTEEFWSLDPLESPFLSAQFGSSHLPYEYDYLGLAYPYPHLADMVLLALEALDDDPDGFFLMIEGGRIDHACHDNHLERAVHETLEFSLAVEMALGWAEGRNDTLILVTADHETGGMVVTQDNLQGNYPTVSWASTSHTGVNVPVYAWGLNAEMVFGVMDNTDIFEICTAETTPVSEASNPEPRNGATGVLKDVILSWEAGAEAVTHKVLFGEDQGALTQIANQAGTSLQLLNLRPGTTYYWAVDELDVSGNLIAAGPVWSFTTLDPPSPIADSDPVNGEVNVSVEVVLAWTAGARAESHEVYFGTDNNPPFVGVQTGTTYDPGALAFGTTYYWRVDEVNGAGTTVGDVYSFTTSEILPPQTYLAEGEERGFGTILTGDWQSTLVSDNVYEALQEELNNPNKNGYSVMEHQWLFIVGGGSTGEFHLEAWRSASSDGDDFIFSYSEDGILYTDMLTVSKLNDTDTPQVFVFPEGLSSGTVYIKVRDTDHTKRNKALDSLYVDQMYILTSAGAMPYYAASFPSPADGAENVEILPTLTWTSGDEAVSHNVYLGTDKEYLDSDLMGNQTDTIFTPLSNLDELVTYYWRIDEVRGDGQIETGPVWSFTTTYVGECNPDTLIVDSVATSKVRGSAGRSFGQATITITDNCGNPISGALVTGTFTGDFNDEVVDELTDENGIAVLTTSTDLKKPEFGFLVDNVQHPELQF